MSYKAIIFDLDGTLLNTLDDLADSMNAVLKNLGFPEHETDAYRYYVGDGMEILCRRVLPEGHRDAVVINKCLLGMREEYGKRWKNKTKPYNGMHETLDHLAQHGIKMAVLSNKPDGLTRLTVEQLLTKWKFDIVLGERPGVPRKPDPAGALEIAKRLDIMPEQIVYLGDTGIDMKTATAAAMYPVGALWGFRAKAELVENGAAMLIAEPLELLKLF